jgi:signal transduction histidine kinase
VALLTFINRFFAQIFLPFFVIFYTNFALAENGTNNFIPSNTAKYKLLFTTELEYVYSDSLIPPTNGYELIDLGELRGRNALSIRGQKFPIVWLRGKFDYDFFQNAPIAFMLGFSRGQVSIFLNGHDVFEAINIKNNQSNNWNDPIFAQLPTSLLKSGENEIHIRIQTSPNLGTRGLYARIGEYEKLEKFYKHQLLTNNIVPLIVSNIIMVLSCSLLVFWLINPRNYPFLWLALFGFARYFRNLLFQIYNVEFDPWLASTISKLIPYIYMFCLIAFPSTFIKFRTYKKLLYIVGISILIIAIAHFSYLYFHGGNLGIFNQISTIITISAALYLTYRTREKPSIENYMVVFALWGYGFFSLYDYDPSAFAIIGMPNELKAYSSTLVYFGATFIYLVLISALGVRTFGVYKTVENLNIILENRVNEATQKLKDSEDARRKLEISLAVENERERIMSEIHDRIGSSLVTTLANARKNAKDTIAIPALKRAITDLKIAVDSLDEIENDIAALLANLRHRLEPDLNEAGIKFDWQVEEVTKLEWLEPISALHILRLLQEAISNMITHSGANIVTLACKSAYKNNEEGIEIMIQDNGIGFDVLKVNNGHGINNMKNRAQSIGGNLEIHSNIGNGTKLICWLPKIR